MLQHRRFFISFLQVLGKFGLSIIFCLIQEMQFLLEHLKSVQPGVRTINNIKKNKINIFVMSLKVSERRTMYSINNSSLWRF